MSGGIVTGIEIMDDVCGTVKTSICKIRNRLDTNGFVNMMFFQVFSLTIFQALMVLNERLLFMMEKQQLPKRQQT